VSAAAGKAYALCLHGGAGAMSSARIPPERVAQMNADLSRALERGAAVLTAGGPALDAVVEAVRVLEDSSVFNAARGSVLRCDGGVYLDASVMSGQGRRAGAVALARTPQNPARLARAVLERGREVLLVGAAADRFATELGHETQPQEYFITEYRRQQLERLWAREALGAASEDTAGQTVGAVALDVGGHLAAATSTGGTINADVGRVGDSPIIGAGTWADDETCAVSATGVGEFFIRSAFAHEVHAHIAHAGADLDRAVRAALARVEQLGGQGGCVAVDAAGNVALPFSTLAMPRAYLRSSGERAVHVF
jgi:beta-aspartyl-peptidase (threonine type)